jgi:hypothetical protein
MGEQAAKAGIQQGLHNENFELTVVDGQRTYDLLLDLLDPKLVKFQFQVSTISRGYDAAEYFMKYPGRFISMHVQDWSSETKKTMAVGQGTLDWKKIFTAAKTGGVKNSFVEMSLDLMKAGVPYLRDLQANGIAELPLTDLAVDAFREQIRIAGPGPWLFPSDENPTGHQKTLKTVWHATLRRAKVPYFRIYDLRSTYATRLSAGGVADEWVTQLLRQGDAKVFKKYSQMKLQMKREALQKINRKANESRTGFDTEKVN